MILKKCKILCFILFLLCINYSNAFFEKILIHRDVKKENAKETIYYSFSQDDLNACLFVDGNEPNFDLFFIQKNNNFSDLKPKNFKEEDHPKLYKDAKTKFLNFFALYCSPTEPFKKNLLKPANKKLFDIIIKTQC
ncbi:hypothetical protein ACFLYU_01010 [Candidatus Dependentiae bacterium]